MEDRDRLDGGENKPVLVHELPYDMEKKCEGKSGGEKLRGIVKRNSKPIGIVIVINSRHLGGLDLVNVTHRVIQLIPPTQGTAL